MSLDTPVTEPESVRPLTRRAMRELASKAEAPATAPTAEQVVIETPEGDLALAIDEVHIAEEEDAAPQRNAAQAALSKPAPVSEDEQGVDLFAQAAKVLGTSAPRIPTPDRIEAGLNVAASTPSHRAPRRGRRRAIAGAASVGVMGLAALLAVTMTMPAQAIAAAQTGDSPISASLVAENESTVAAIPEDQIQAFVASAEVQNEAMERSDEFSTLSLAQVAAESGIRYSNAIYTNDPDAAIQWPYVVGVGMSWGYGMRWGRLHAGLDLTPGAGAPIQAIADGVVRIATESGGAYGVTVYVDHVIDGNVITSHYAHMQYGSLQVKQGDTIKVGDIIGLTGNTGRSFGAHLHFELIVNGATIDPLPWMKENAGRYEY